MGGQSLLGVTSRGVVGEAEEWFGWKQIVGVSNTKEGCLDLLLLDSGEP